MVFVLAALLAPLVSGCGEEDGGTLSTAPEIALTDVNPTSPTHGETRTLSQADKVMLVYFVSYG